MNRVILRNKIRRVSVLLSLLSGIILIGFFALKSFLPPQMRLGAIILLASLFALAMGLTIAHSLLQEGIIHKLSIIPIVYGLGIAGYLFYKTGAVASLLLALGIPATPVESDQIFEVMSTTFPLLMNGIWLTVLPIIGYVIWQYFTMTKNSTKDISTFTRSSGWLRDLEATGTYINQQRVYNLTIEFLGGYGEPLTIKKSSIIPAHLVHHLVSGSPVDLLVDPKDEKNVVIWTPDGAVG